MCVGGSAGQGPKHRAGRIERHSSSGRPRRASGSAELSSETPASCCEPWHSDRFAGPPACRRRGGNASESSRQGKRARAGRLAVPFVRSRLSLVGLLAPRAFVVLTPSESARLFRHPLSQPTPPPPACLPPCLARRRSRPSSVAGGHHAGPRTCRHKGKGKNRREKQE